MPSWLTPVLTTIGVILVAVVGAAASRYAARLSARAASRQVDVSEWQAIVAELRKEISRLGDRIESLETAQAAHRSLVVYARTLLAWIQRTVPHETPPAPPTAFVDELTYITER